MTAASTSNELHFEPPGPGFWELDPVHFPRPATRYWIETHPAAFKRGTSEFARAYGMLTDSRWRTSTASPTKS
jgi:rifampicin phosphotransferase